MVIYQIASGLPRSFAFTLKMTTSPLTNRTVIVYQDVDIELGLQSLLYSYSILTFLCFFVVVVGTIFLVRRFTQSRHFRATATRAESESNNFSVKDIRLIRFVIFGCVVYIMGAAPNVIIGVTSAVYPRMNMNDPYFGNFHNTLVAIVITFQAISCSVNIFIYMGIGSKFKQTVKRTFLCIS